jgi:hypothetical protein
MISQYFVGYLYFDKDFWLAVWNVAFMTFHSVGNVIIPTDALHHVSEGLAATTNQF